MLWRRRIKELKCLQNFFNQFWTCSMVLFLFFYFWRLMKFNRSGRIIFSSIAFQDCDVSLQMLLFDMTLFAKTETSIAVSNFQIIRLWRYSRSTHLMSSTDDIMPGNNLLPGCLGGRRMMTICFSNSFCWHAKSSSQRLSSNKCTRERQEISV